MIHMDSLKLYFPFLPPVETIGDCYVAVTGVPDPQPDHAVRMVKFARDCYSKMSYLLPELTERLGEDTSALNFRVGLHSGGVTGGVLRGQKSRFQVCFVKENS